MPLNLIITTAGAAALANATTSGTAIAVSRIAFGSSADAHTVASTVLHTHIRDFGIEQIIPAGNTITFKATIPASWGGYWLREIGLVTTDGTLLAVSSMDFYKPAGASGFDLNFEASLTLADIDQIATEVDGVIEGVNTDLELIAASLATVEDRADEVVEKHGVVIAAHGDITVKHAEIVGDYDVIVAKAAQVEEDAAAASEAAGIATAAAVNNLKHQHNIHPSTMNQDIALDADDRMIRLDVLTVNRTLTIAPGAMALIL